MPPGPGLDGLAWVVVQGPLRVALALARPAPGVGLATRDFGISLSGPLVEIGIGATNKPERILKTNFLTHRGTP